MRRESNEDREELLSEIRSLKAELRKVRAAEQEHAEQLAMVDTIKELREEISTLKINKSKLTEDHEREKREVKHMVGLERQRQEFEVEQAKRETTVTIREENLAADRKRFEEQMQFTTDRFEAEVGYLKELMGEVLDRLPTVTVDKSVATKR